MTFAVLLGSERRGVVADLFTVEPCRGRLLEFQVELLILPPLLEAVDADVAEQVFLVRRNPVALDKFEQREKRNDNLQPGRVLAQKAPKRCRL